jgi:type I restriction enzyme S subunit
VAYLPKSIYESMSRTKTHQGDSLLNIARTSIGQVAWVNVLPEEANVNQHVCIIRLNRTKAKPEFISACISLPFGQRQIDKMPSGASRQGLNYQQVSSLTFSLSPLLLQRRYSKAVRMVRKVSDQREQGCMVSEDLFNASVQQAFRGELTSDGGK